MGPGEGPFEHETRGEPLYNNEFTTVVFFVKRSYPRQLTVKCVVLLHLSFKGRQIAALG